jgi:hypothetical protein
MSKLIGTAPNQVPSNADLGGMAYQNPESVVIKPQESATPSGIGDVVFELTSDGTLTIKAKVSTGDVKSAPLVFDSLWPLYTVLQQGVPDFDEARQPYSINALVRHTNKVWRSLVDTNNTTPSESASWTEIGVAASTTVKGLVELATDAEAVLTSVVDKALVPANLLAIFGEATQVGNAYIRVPVVVGGGLEEIIIQWGVATGVTAGGGGNVTFPIPFPTAFLSAVASIVQSGGTSAASGAGWGSQSNTGMTVFNNGTVGPTGVSWIAIGY